MITLENSDGETFQVTTNTFVKFIEYCKKHFAASDNDFDGANDDHDIEAWDAEFVKVDMSTLYELILAAYRLKFQSLLDLTTQAVADMIRGKNPFEMAEILNIETGYTPEEKDEIRREHPWAFD